MLSRHVLGHDHGGPYVGANESANTRDSADRRTHAVSDDIDASANDSSPDGKSVAFANGVSQSLPYRHTQGQIVVREPRDVRHVDICGRVCCALRLRNY